MPKIQTTTFNTSTQLHTEMSAKGLYPLYTANDSVWLSNSVQALFIGDVGGSGGKANTNTDRAGGSGAAGIVVIHYNEGDFLQFLL